MADLQELFARLKAQSSETNPQSSSPQSSRSQQPSIWTNNPPFSNTPPLFSPPAPAATTANPFNPARSASAAGSVGSSDPQRTNNLLNLLKFNNPSPGGQQAQSGAMASLQDVSIGRSSSAAGNHNLQLPLSGQDSKASFGHASTPSATQQDFLLNLLKKPAATAPATNGADVTAVSSKPAGQKSTDLTDGSALRSSTATPIRHFGSPEVGGSSFQAPHLSQSTKFTHVNPFDALHASSPLNRSANAGNVSESNVEDHKHQRDVSSVINGDVRQPSPKQRKLMSESEVKAGEPKSVSQTLEGVGQTVDKEVKTALAAATKRDGQRAVESQASPSKSPENQDGLESSWESAEDSANDKVTTVRVFNFPMKPFTVIKISDKLQPVQHIRQDNFMQIAVLKKDFDQIDRCLAAASQSHIVYAQPGTKKEKQGLKIIHQDTGEHKSLFQQSGERVFNVQVCTPAEAANDVETVLGTGVDGSVFWTSLARSQPELFADDDVEAQGFMMPPVATVEENTSGSPIKTRAKMSSRNPEFFAIGRGKQIHIIAPDVVKDYCDRTTRKVDSQKFFAEHSLKLSTGKAGKDFCFSEDDSTIVSLDKSGRVKFWDVRALTSRALDRTTNEAVNLSDPLWQLNAAASTTKADEKPSVSSVMLLDKEKPYARGGALRYMLIGFKQNHILQLWDLGLGKAVQEVCLPHEKDSDGICSITYHPKTGVIAIAHPTRNSIYFIHLSAPKYSLAAMEQAQYIKFLASNDTSLPRPDSTAIMSGVRELSFAKAGQLRSLEMLRTPVEQGGEKGSEDETLFELYAMHAKGVTGVSIKKADLGWNQHSKMVDGVDGKDHGVIEVSDLKFQAQDTTPSEPETTASTASKKTGEKKDVRKPETPKKVEVKKQEPASATPLNPAKPTASAASAVPTAPIPTSASYSTVAQRSEPAARETLVSDTPKQDLAIRQAPAQPNVDVSRQFEALYQRLESDRRVAEAAGTAKQDAMLRLISSTLTDNVEQSLHHIVGSSIEEKVLPVLSDTTSKIVERKLSELLPQQLSVTLQQEIKSVVPNAVQTALKDPQVLRTISALTANELSVKVQQQVSALLQDALPKMVAQASQKMAGDVEKRSMQQLHDAELRHQQDNAKIDELSHMLRNLSTTMQTLVSKHSTLHEQVAQLRGAPPPNDSRSGNNGVPEHVELDAETSEVRDLTALLTAGRYEDATLQWLQSSQQGQLFDDLFIRVNPRFLETVNPLVKLSVSAAITATFETNVDQRLEWLSSIIDQLNVQDHDIVDVAPGIMDVLSQRLQGAYMNIAESDSTNPVLRKISEVNRRVNHIRALLR